MPEHAMGSGSQSRFALIPALAATLLVLFTLSVWLGPAPSIGMWFMLVLPLAMLMKGLRENRPRALQWLGFLDLFYFTIGILQLFSDSVLYKTLGLFTTVCCLSLFVAVIVAIRRQGNAEQQTPAKQEADK
jgi:uncharacterized membrane protein